MTTTIDQQFIEYIVKSLVGHPDDVQIERTIDEKGVLLELTVNPEDLGRVIGKRGATAQSLRTLLRALGTKNDARYNLKIIDNGDGGHRAPQDDNSSYAASPQSNNPSDSSTSDDSSNDSHDEPQAQVQDEQPQPAEQEEPQAENPEAPASDDYMTSLREDSQEEADHSDAISRTRSELADLDDLDI